MENKVVFSVTRRDIVAFAVGGVLTAGGFKLKQVGDQDINLPELYDLVKNLNPPSEVKAHLSARQAFAAHYLDDFYRGIQDGLKETPVLKGVVDDLIADDFREDRVQYIDGWSMAHTEIALCLLS